MKPEGRGPSLVEPDRILTVSELSSLVKLDLETSFPRVWVVGEISNLHRHTSGHTYLSLKDASASVNAVIWRGDGARIKFELRDGLQVLCRGRVTAYAPRSQYQLVVDQVEPKGKGALQLAFEQLKEKLKAEGLFAAERKRPLPLRPKAIGVVTSPRGAALVDILRTLERRGARLRVLIYPARVQGEGAADQIVAGIEALGREPGLDVLIVGRGGGSIEDLWAFNEERVARAVAAAPIPVISAVGHEVDFTIVDFVADIRASTPTAAAEMVIEAEEVFARRIENLARQAFQCVRLAVQEGRHEVLGLTQHRIFQTFRMRLLDLGQRVDELETRALGVVRREKERIAEARGRAALARERLAAGLRARLRESASRTALLAQRAGSAVRAVARERQSAWEKLAAALQGQSPLAVLRKGYAVVFSAGSAPGPAPTQGALFAGPAGGGEARRSAGRAAVTGISDVGRGDDVVVAFHKGEFRARVTSVDPRRKIEETIGTPAGPGDEE